MHKYNAVTQEVEVGGSEIQEHSDQMDQWVKALATETHGRKRELTPTKIDDR